VPDVHIFFEGDMESSEAMLIVEAQGLDQQELAGTLLDVARTLGAASPRPATPRFNPQPRGRR